MIFGQETVDLVRWACCHRPDMTAVHLFGILLLLKATNQMANRLFQISPTGFDTALLIGKYFSSGYLWAIAVAMLLSKVVAIAQLQPFC